MFVLAWLLVSGASIGHFRVAASEVSQNGCQTSHLRLIESYFEATTLERGDFKPLYCVIDKQLIWGFPKSMCKPAIDLSQLVDLYISFANVKRDMHYSPQDPIVDGGVLSINHTLLPLWQEADIRRRHLAGPNSYPGYGDDVREQMDVMGILTTDDRGYLLPHSLGGPTRALNMIPMARNVNHHLSLEPEDSGLGSPRSNWRSHENWIRKFLLHAYPNGRVAWKLAVQYEDRVFTDYSMNSSYRPLSFSLQYHAFSNEHDDNSVYYISPQMTFLNDNNNYCPGDNVYRHRQGVKVPADCTVDNPSTNAGTIGKQVCHETSLWATTHVVSFPINIQEKTYIYSQRADDEDQKFPWSIKKILSTGEVGEVASYGYWNKSYPVSFPYFINGKHYFYAHNIENKEWFIRELLPEGKIGEEKSNGNYDVSYPTSFHYTINGKHYFYCHGQRDRDDWHHRNDDQYWFIRELLWNGQMGRTITSDWRDESYPVVFPYSINNRHMFYAHNPETKKWFVQELLPDGRMGEELNRGRWNNSYHVSFSYSVGEKYYFYGLDTVTEGNHTWFIQELLPNGKMGKEISTGHENNSYSIAFPFAIHNKGRYIYQHSNEANEWKVHELR